jgi:hypothetical protein
MYGSESEDGNWTALASHDRTTVTVGTQDVEPRSIFFWFSLQQRFQQRLDINYLHAKPFRFRSILNFSSHQSMNLVKTPVILPLEIYTRGSVTFMEQQQESSLSLLSGLVLRLAGSQRTWISKVPPELSSVGPR